MKQKLIYVITKSSWGGAQRYVYDLATAYADEYDVLIVHGKNEFGKEPLFESRLQASGIKTKRIESLGRNISLLGDMGAFISLLILFWKERPDVVHLNSSKIGGVGALAGKIARVKTVVFTTHGLPFFEPRPWLQTKMITLLSRITAKLVDQLIVVAQFEYDFIKNNWKNILPKTTLIYNGLPHMSHKTKQEARSWLSAQTQPDSYGLVSRHNTLWLGSIGELNRNKGFDMLLENLHRLKEANIPVLFFHFGTGVDEKKLKKLTKEYGLEDRVFWLGFNKEAPLLLRGLDSFVLPSRKEGFPYVLLEAGMAGTALVGTDAGGIPEIIKHGSTGLTAEIQDPRELARLIQSYQQNPELRSQYASAAKKHIAQHFSIEQMIKKTRQVYNR